MYKLDGKWEVENLKRISVFRTFQYVLNSVGIKKSVAIAFLLKINLNL